MKLAVLIIGGGDGEHDDNSDFSIPDAPAMREQESGVRQPLGYCVIFPVPF
jgi:hypothetical protein